MIRPQRARRCPVSKQKRLRMALRYRLGQLNRAGVYSMPRNHLLPLGLLSVVVVDPKHTTKWHRDSVIRSHVPPGTPLPHSKQLHTSPCPRCYRPVRRLHRMTTTTTTTTTTKNRSNDLHSRPKPPYASTVRLLGHHRLGRHRGFFHLCSVLHWSGGYSWQHTNV